MQAGRIRALELMEKLKRQAIESDAQELNDLRAEALRLDQRRERLEREMTEGAQTDDPAMRTYLGDYLRSMRSEIARVERDRKRIEPGLNRLEQRVATAFREMKTYESVRVAGMALAKDEAQRAEDAAEAEMAVMRWWRARQGAGRT